MDKKNKNHFKALILFLLVFLTFAAYRDILHHGFMEFLEDNRLYITENPVVQSGLNFKSLEWAFTTTHGWNWFPLTWISHMMDCELFGLNPSGHHLISLIIHILNSLLLFYALYRLTGNYWGSVVTAYLFALHPMHVESVAWIAERKDLLSSFFFMICLITYDRYVKNPVIRNYLIVVAFFAMGLMAKPMLVTLPFVLLLLDFWPFSRMDLPFLKIKGEKSKIVPRSFLYLIKEKIPLFILSAVSIVVTLFAQRGLIRSLEDFPLAVRLENAIISYTTYIYKMVWPVELGIFYPHTGAKPLWVWAGSAVILIGITCLAILWIRRKPYLLTGWLWFLGMLIPVIGIVQVGQASMADRYSYLPYVGLSLMAAWSLPDLNTIGPLKRYLTIGGVTIIIIFFWAGTWNQVRYWRSDISLLERTIDVTKNNDVAYSNLGTAFNRKGLYKKAISAYQASLKIRPDQPSVYFNLGIAFSGLRNIEKTIESYKKAIELKPDYSQAHFNLGNLYFDIKKMDLAVRHFEDTVRLRPENQEYQNNLAIAYAVTGQKDRAISMLKRLLEKYPNHTGTRRNYNLMIKSRSSEKVR